MKIKPVNSSPVPKGILLAIGGHENKGEQPETEEQKRVSNPLEVLKDFVKLTGKDKPLIEVITTATEEADLMFRDYKKVFKELGTEKLQHIHHQTRGDALRNKQLERIKKADAVFFTGGDQLKLTAVYGGTEFLFELKQRYIHDRIVIGGTSAGAMALSTPMIYAGSREVQEIGGEIKITLGLEFLKDVCIDTHFTDRARFVRMAQVIATNPNCIGMGIGEDTGMIITEGRNIKVIGSGIIIVFDGFNIEDSNVLQFGEQLPIALRGLRVHLLVRGDEYEVPQTNPPHI
ncbi:MAG TPA: cyanophycinase [Sphingobacteriaceae bacterium]